jgi:alkylation response protein AidB-like acyl-CoA dehydrogenase
MRFVRYELHGLAPLQALPGGDELTPEFIDSILEQAARFCEQELAPLNRSGDHEGCRFENGRVWTPNGFAAAFRRYADAGWIGLASDREYGGEGLPLTLRAFIDEMTCSANLQFASYTNLIHGASALLQANASDHIKRDYLTRLVRGMWGATMCLTEPQSGSDLSLLKSKAVPDNNGRFRVSGDKVFISAGDHDLTENIVHLILARLPDAPPGTRGISLFLVPKLLPDRDGKAVVANGVSCVSIESKMGMRGSATCSMRFDGSLGWLIGEPNRGLQAMFAMLNSARLGASLQGLGIAEAAYQQAVAYARERLQGRFPSGAKYPDKIADPIIVHPDIRRMLLTMRAYVEGMRALAQWVAQAIDRRELDPTPSARTEADELVSLMTPILKAAFTDFGSECANLGVQVLGGAGYIRDHGMEQHVRDVRVTQIYDGTNGIQALDLLQRKIARDRLARRFFDWAKAQLRTHANEFAMAEFVQPCSRKLQLLEMTTDKVLQAALSRPDEVAAVATDYLRLFALVALGFQWAAMAAVAIKRVDSSEQAFYQAKIGTARFYLRRILPQCRALAAVIMSDDKSLLEFAEEAF